MKRLAGVLVTLVVLGALYFFWRSMGGGTASAPAVIAPVRGGELVAQLRTDPRSFNRLVAGDETSAIVASLTQAPLVRVNRATFELEPWLAEKWDAAADGREFTLHLREGLQWSDGQPLTSADVLFTLQAALDKRTESIVTDSLKVAGAPITMTAPDPRTVVVRLPAAFGPGLRLLNDLPILPKHKLESAFAAGTLRTAWATSTPPAEIVGAGPFVLKSYETGQRVVLERNPHFFRKAVDGTQLPYLDRLRIEIIPEQNAAMLRLQAGQVDLLQSEVRPEDYTAARRAETEGKLKLVELGVSADADGFWFCLKPDAKKGDKRFAFVQKREFRQAISHAVDREAFAQTVFLGEAVPVWGPVTPGNKPWFSPNQVRYPYDLEKARGLLKSIGLEDRDGNGVVEDAAGTEARFTVMTQQGITASERGVDVLKRQAAMIGVALDIAPLEGGTMVQRMLASDYDAIYMRVLSQDLDPASQIGVWLSSGDFHFWNLGSKTPATEWERRIDTIMTEQVSTIDPARRKEMFADVQRIFEENVPALYFAAPRMFYAVSTRVTGLQPSILRPPALWNADSLGVNGK